MVLREMQLRHILVACALGVAPAIASAQEAPAPAGAGGGTVQLTLPKGRLLLSGALEIGLNDGAAFKPISISPDLWYGVSDELTVGLVHSTAGLSGFVGGLGDSICLSGTGGFCPKLYNEVAIDGRYKLTVGGPDITLAADGALVFRSLDPLALSVKLGAVGRWAKDQLAVELQPSVVIGVTERDAFGDVVSIPVAGIYSIDPKLAVSAQTGIILPLQATGDTYSVPLSIAGHYLVTPQFSALAAFTLSKVIGGGAGAGIDARVLTLGGAYAF
jgi:hypothetical protein